MQQNNWEYLKWNGNSQRPHIGEIRPNSCDHRRHFPTCWSFQPKIYHLIVKKMKPSLSPSMHSMIPLSVPDLSPQQIYIQPYQSIKHSS
uniref:Uncharacterized protein n=1 Tax=Pyxicephalus adspersus TaxID=30357 RepID=A0AAV2ZVM6_PYXAD|nr:TPA: hypothetical protein GDO54_016702 [Pyxicephalus adspersus]